MIRVILHGAAGFMGKVVTDQVASADDMEIVAGLDVTDPGDRKYPVYATGADCKEAADVIIDFSVAQAVDGLLDFALARKLPLVLCTTGLSDEQLAKVADASKEIPILRSANMSLGINLLMTLVKEAAALLCENGFDAEIVEMHHRRKLDAPSGTAMMLAEAVRNGAGDAYEAICDRSTRREARGTKEIGVQALRGGTVVGMHEVFFAGEDEIVSIKHTANSRAIFAKGAMAAARFLATQKAGLYSMADVIG